MGMILVTASVAVFVWAVVGLIRPTWARLPSRAASVGVWFLSVVLFIIGGALMPDSTPERAADGGPCQQRYRCAVRLPRVWQPNCGSAERRSFSELVLAAVRVLTSGLDRPVVVGVRRQLQRWRCHGRGQQLEHRLERTGSEVCCFVP